MSVKAVVGAISFTYLGCSVSAHWKHYVATEGGKCYVVPNNLLADSISALLPSLASRCLALQHLLLLLANLASVARVLCAPREALTLEFCALRSGEPC